MITMLTTAVILLCITGFLLWIFSNLGYTFMEGVAKVTLQGKIQLWMLRTAAPMITNVDKSLGFVKYAMEKLPQLELSTTHGIAKLTFYRPVGLAGLVLPLYINHHGGGFVVGYPEQDDMICRYIALHAKCLVVNVDYVLAPEHAYPAQILQCMEVAESLKKNAVDLNVDPNRIAVGGQSAGASISAALCLMAKERGLPLFCTQILNYGYFDTKESPSNKFIEKGTKQALGPKMLGFFQNLYLPIVSERTQALASPLLAEDLSGLPDALIITAQHDLMKTDGNRYAEKLLNNGVNVLHREFQSADHGFTHNGPKESAQAALKLMAKTLKTKFYSEEE